MLTETAEIVKIEAGALWVRASQKTACGSCAAEKSCGQGVLAKWAADRSLLQVNIDPETATKHQLGDLVTIGIEEDVVVASTLILYFLPLLMMLLGAVLGFKVFATDQATAVLAILGLVLGGMIAARVSRHHKKSLQVQPVLVSDHR